jgi:hypothetical protein
VATEVSALEELAQNESRKRAVFELYCSLRRGGLDNGGRTQHPFAVFQAGPCWLAKVKALATKPRYRDVAFNPDATEARKDPLLTARINCGTTMGNRNVAF